MSRIQRKAPSPAAPKKTAAKKPAPEADAHAPTKAVERDIASMKKSKRASVETSADGKRTTRERTTQRRDSETRTTTNETKGHLLESSFEYGKSTSRPGQERETAYANRTDMLGRRSSEAHTTTTTGGEGRTDSRTSGKATDIWNVTKRTLDTSSDVELENGTESSQSRTARDSLGNRHTSSDVTRVVGDEHTTVTTNERRARGSELNTSSSTTWENGVFRLNDSADWNRGVSVDKSYMKETAYDASRVVKKADKLAQTVDKVLEWLGIDPAEIRRDVDPERMHEVTWGGGENSWVGARYGVSGTQGLNFDGRGVNADFSRDARAGVYANAQGATEGRFGQASYEARARAEAYATVDGRARLDTNGLDANVGARVGAVIDAEVTGQARTKGITVGDTEIYAGVDGRALVSAEASAEATGHVQVTRNPPTAIAEGTVGASAVAKAEAEIRATAGPFTVVANVYASAGAEAKATGVIGYSDGKLRIGGSAGAALGVGAGGGVAVEVDVHQMGEIAKQAADVNHDGKLDLQDAGAAIVKTARFAARLWGLHL